MQEAQVSSITTRQRKKFRITIEKWLQAIACKLIKSEFMIDRVYIRPMLFLKDLDFWWVPDRRQSESR
ncbi:hypothetical protein RBSWK_02198 [Rhodopirellula baltica SWK14]|uniref:Uncharacterized protein n=1 Tax=Rhodopirellula baltica SWK14 TaxID=993516 RepID=L7CKB0_RHOBT|nr:hypothetical protein RBSWK_02198 [Rhodopirellula baltica SWK14]